MKKTLTLILFTLLISCISVPFAMANSYPRLILKNPVEPTQLSKDNYSTLSSRLLNNDKNLTNGKNQRPSNWQRVSVNTIDDHSDMQHIIWETTRPPYGEWDRIALHRVVLARNGEGPAKNKRKVIFMLPGTWGAAGWSQLTNPDFNTMLFLAEKGYDVYTITFRSAFLPNVTYEQFTDLEINITDTINWTYGVYVEDIKQCSNKIKKISKAKTFFMSGFSRGSDLMFIYASKYPQDLKGLISFDGIFKNYPAISEEAVDEETFNYYIDLLKLGQLPVKDDCDSVLCPPAGTNYQLLNEATWEYYDTWQLASVVPYAQNMVGEALPTEFETISDFVANDANYKWGEGIFSNYNGGYVDREVLIKSMGEFSRYWPTIQDFEGWQLSAWDDVPYFDYDDNPVDLPAIAFMSPSFCPEETCLDNNIPNMTINEDVTIYYLEGYGHIDVMIGSDSKTAVKEPLLEWLNHHF